MATFDLRDCLLLVHSIEKINHGGEFGSVDLCHRARAIGSSYSQRFFDVSRDSHDVHLFDQVQDS